MKTCNTTRYLSICLFLLCLPAARAQDRSNIVLVFMDNFGCGEPGFNGGGIVRGAPTPRLDRLASEGLRPTNFNVEVQCTPSRSAIMTGRYAIRSGNGTVPLGGGIYGLVQWEVTTAEMLSDAGYATGMFGKWHLGRTPGRFPTDQGFDEWYGIPNSTDESAYSELPGFAESGVEETYVMEGSKGEEPRSLRPYRLDYRALIDGDLTDKAIDTPRVYNLLTDPQERESVLFPATWVPKAALGQLRAHIQSLGASPPIRPGTKDPYEPAVGRGSADP